jgi:hypothetical protein
LSNAGITVAIAKPLLAPSSEIDSATVDADGRPHHRPRFPRSFATVAIQALDGVRDHVRHDPSS